MAVEQPGTALTSVTQPGDTITLADDNVANPGDTI